MLREEKSNSGAFITVEEAAKRHGVSISTIQRWVDSGKLEGYRDPEDGRKRRLIRVRSNRDQGRPEDKQNVRRGLGGVGV